jgi:hypothetical protein
MTVQEVFDPFEDTADGFVPAEGTHPVMVQVQVENSGEMPFELRPDQVIVQDNDGYLWRQSNVPRVVEEIVIPDLQRVVLAPGDRVTGMVGFQIPTQASVATVLLSPESSRLLVMSSIADVGDGLGDLGDAIAYTDPVSGAEGEITITEIADPFEDYREGSDPQPDTRYVLVTVTVENTGTEPLSISPGAFVLQDAAGYLWTSGFVPREPDVTVPDLQSQQLAPGSRVSGVIGYVLAADIELAGVVLQPEFSRIIPLYVVES